MPGGWGNTLQITTTGGNQVRAFFRTGNPVYLTNSNSTAYATITPSVSPEISQKLPLQLAGLSASLPANLRNSLNINSLPKWSRFILNVFLLIVNILFTGFYNAYKLLLALLLLISRI